MGGRDADCSRLVPGDATVATLEELCTEAFSFCFAPILLGVLLRCDERRCRWTLPHSEALTAGRCGVGRHDPHGVVEGVSNRGTRRHVCAWHVHQEAEFAAPTRIREKASEENVGLLILIRAVNQSSIDKVESAGFLVAVNEERAVGVLLDGVAEQRLEPDWGGVGDDVGHGAKLLRESVAPLSNEATSRARR